MTEPKRHKDPERNKLLNYTVARLNAIVNLHDPEVDVPINDGIWDVLDEVVWKRERALLARAEAAEAAYVEQFDKREAAVSSAERWANRHDALSARLAEVEAERDGMHEALLVIERITDGGQPFSEAVETEVWNVACAALTDAQERRG